MGPDGLKRGRRWAAAIAARLRRRSGRGGDDVSLEAVTRWARSLPAGVIAFDESRRITLFTPRAEELLGHRPGDVAGRSIVELVPASLRDQYERAVARLEAVGQRDGAGDRLDGAAVRADGSILPVSWTLTRVNSHGPATFVAYLVDTTADRRASAAQQLLADTADLLASSLDYEATLRDVARLAVPRLADWCAIDLPGPHGRLEPVAIAHADEDKVAVGRELRRRYPVDEHDALVQVARFGGSVLQEHVGDDDLAAYAREEAHLALLKEVGFRSLMVVPLMAGRRTIGAITFVAAESDRHFDKTDLALAEELGRRAGTALENARLYRERSELAQTLVGALRPPGIPTMAGWSAAAVYEPAGRSEEVGGDFYDLISVGSDWMLVIGDVVGKGPAAAARTSLARYSIRTASTLTGSPAQALRHLNEDLHREGQGGLMSAACVLLHETADGAEATIAAAGHPLPILVSGGEARVVGRPSLMLGVAAGASITEETVAVADGDTLLLYTDGVPDAKGRDDRFGFQRLITTLHGDAESSVEEVLRRVVDGLAAFQYGAQTDDIAMLAVRRDDEGTTAASPRPGAHALAGQHAAVGLGDGIRKPGVA